MLIANRKNLLMTKKQQFKKCEYCGKITFDRFLVSDLWRPNKWKYLHVACLEKIINRPLEMYDLVIHPDNWKFLYTYSIWCPDCQFRKRNRCQIDGKQCRGWCHFKTESRNRLEGALLIYEIRRRNNDYTD